MGSNAAGMIILNLDFFGKNVSLDECAKNAFAWSCKNILNTESIWSPALNSDIRFSKNGLRHTINQKKYINKGGYTYESITVISIFYALVESAQIHDKGQDKYGSKNISSIIKLRANFLSGDLVKEIEFLLKEVYTKDGTEIIFYNHAVL